VGDCRSFAEVQKYWSTKGYTKLQSALDGLTQDGDIDRYRLLQGTLCELLDTRRGCADGPCTRRSLLGSCGDGQGRQVATGVLGGSAPSVDRAAGQGRVVVREVGATRGGGVRQFSSLKTTEEILEWLEEKEEEEEVALGGQLIMENGAASGQGCWGLTEGRMGLEEEAKMERVQGKLSRIAKVGSGSHELLESDPEKETGPLARPLPAPSTESGPSGLWEWLGALWTSCQCSSCVLRE